MRRMMFVVAGLLAPASLTAQVPGAVTRALGMGGAYTALARGYEAVAWNPAMLAATGRPGVSIALPQAATELGSNTYGFSDFRTYANRTLSDADKQDLLNRITADDSVLRLRTVAGVIPIALSIGPFALSLSTAGDMDMTIGRDAVELALLGNAARSDPGEFFTAAGASARGWAVTTLAGSFAQAFRLPMGRLALGVTYKRITGHFIGRAAETASSFAVNPTFQVTAAGHAIYTSYPDNYDPSGFGDIFGGDAKAGSGFGVDVGGVLQLGGRRLTLSAVLVNALGSMEWDPARFRYDRVAFVVQETGGTLVDSEVRTSLEGSAISGDAGARALRDEVLANSDFSRYIRGGAAWRWGALSVAGDVLVRLTEGLDRVPAKQVAGGAEYRLLGFLPLRGGVATDLANTLMVSAGTGLSLFGVNVDASIAHLGGDVRPGIIVGFGMGIIF